MMLNSLTKVWQQVKLLFGLLLLGYAIYALAFYFMQRKMVFPRQLTTPIGWDRARFPELQSEFLQGSEGRFEVAFLPALSDGRATGGAQGEAELPNDHEISPLAIIAHGNANLIDYWPERITRLRSMGFAVLLVEYPGYGRSDGAPSQRAIVDGFVQAYDWVLTRPEISAEQILYVGRSLGGGVMLQLARERPPRALMVMSSFVSVKHFARHYGLPGFLARDPFDSLEAVKQLEQPILFVHGTKDDIIPAHHSTRMHQAARNAELLWLDCDHNNCPLDWNEFWLQTRPFLCRAGFRLPVCDQSGV